MFCLLLARDFGIDIVKLKLLTFPNSIISQLIDAFQIFYLDYSALMFSVTDEILYLTFIAIHRDYTPLSIPQYYEKVLYCHNLEQNKTTF